MSQWPLIPRPHSQVFGPPTEATLFLFQHSHEAESQAENRGLNKRAVHLLFFLIIM